MASADIYQLHEALMECPRGNVIEWYILPKGDNNTDPLWMTLASPNSLFPSIRFRHPVALEEYRYKELLYSYDRSNDGQRTIYREALSESVRQDAESGVYRVVFQEDSLPSHRFPCSGDMVKNDSYVRRSFKINNRLFLIEETMLEDTKTPMYQYYLRYNHAANVDIVKMQADLNQFIARYKF